MTETEAKRESLRLSGVKLCLCFPTFVLSIFFARSRICSSVSLAEGRRGTGVMKRHAPCSLALQNIILHHASCQPDGRCSGTGIAQSSGVKRASVMDGDAHEASLSVFMCMRSFAVSPGFLLLSISQPMKGDHPDFVRRSQKGNCKRWTENTVTKKKP